jgi:hypothetical protein
MAITLEQFRKEMIGFELYAEGNDIESCANDTERKGWRMAKIGKEHCDDLDAMAIKDWAYYGAIDADMKEQERFGWMG